MTDDIVARLRQEWEYGNNAKGCDYEMFSQAADEIEHLRQLIKAFVHQWEQDEIGKGNGTDYFHAVHAMREAVRGE